MKDNEYHVPVLLQESIDALNIIPHGNYVDATYGGGGHSREILKKLNSKGNLYAFDQDEDAISNVEESEKLHFIHSNFRYLKNFMEYYGVISLDGILLDLGVSSFQFDSEERGFSFRFDQDLDMRMAAGLKMSASDVLKKYTEKELLQMLSDYGEVRNAKTLAKAIVSKRQAGEYFETTQALNALLDQLRIGDRNRYFAQVYQALRIEVNDEMSAFKDFLSSAKDLLVEGGRLVVISYHSLEDRITKRFMKTGNPEGEMIQDAYGKIDRPFKIITKKPVLPNDEELNRNSRSRSAKLRVAEKIDNERNARKTRNT